MFPLSRMLFFILCKISMCIHSHLFIRSHVYWWRHS